jgi:hypothetical protein
MTATFSTYAYLSATRISGGGFIVEGQRDRLPAGDARRKVGDYTITAKNWKGQRCYLAAYADGRKIFDGCFIGLREWSCDEGRKQAYAINFDKVVGQHISQELADAVVKFLTEVW